MQHSLFSSDGIAEQKLPHSTKAIGLPSNATEVANGVRNLFYDLGYSSITEMRLASGRRADVVGLDRRGRFSIVEIKTSRADLRSDHKWFEYRDFCDDFYFAVPVDFPLQIVPNDTGLIVADRFAGEIIRSSTRCPMPSARRSRQIMQFARTAGVRLWKRERHFAGF